VFILLVVTVTPNGPFRRPHPALWRFTFSLSIVYELVLIFVLFQVRKGGVVARMIPTFKVIILFRLLMMQGNF
jgi:hypothetical protein